MFPSQLSTGACFRMLVRVKGKFVAESKHKAIKASTWWGKYNFYMFFSCVPEEGEWQV